MSGISSVNNTPAYIPPAQTSSPTAPAGTPAAPAAAPAAAGDSAQVGGGQAASGDLQMFTAAAPEKDVAPPLPPPEEIKQTAAPDIVPYTAPPTPKQDVQKPEVQVQTVQQSQPIKKTHFSIIEGPATPDP